MSSFVARSSLFLAPLVAGSQSRRCHTPAARRGPLDRGRLGAAHRRQPGRGRTRRLAILAPDNAGRVAAGGAGVAGDRRDRGDRRLPGHPDRRDEGGDRGVGRRSGEHPLVGRDHGLDTEFGVSGRVQCRNLPILHTALTTLRSRPGMPSSPMGGPARPRPIRRSPPPPVSTLPSPPFPRRRPRLPERRPWCWPISSPTRRPDASTTWRPKRQCHAFGPVSASRATWRQGSRSAAPSARRRRRTARATAPTPSGTRRRCPAARGSGNRRRRGSRPLSRRSVAPGRPGC